MLEVTNFNERFHRYGECPYCRITSSEVLKGWIGKTSKDGVICPRCNTFIRLPQILFIPKSVGRPDRDYLAYVRASCCKGCCVVFMPSVSTPERTKVANLEAYWLGNWQWLVIPGNDPDEYWPYCNDCKSKLKQKGANPIPYRDKPFGFS